MVPPTTPNANGSANGTLGDTPSSAVQAVLVQSEPMPAQSVKVQGYDFNNGVDYSALLASYSRTGYQATSLGQAIDEINRMISWRLSDDPIAEDEQEQYLDPEVRSTTKCKIFLGYTSNLVSSGLREVIRYLVEHSMVDCIVASAGGVEEDIIKCLGPTYVGSFSLPGAELRKKGLNRIGNLLVPNDNYCKFEDWVMPVLDQMLKEQKEEGTIWTPSAIIRRLGKAIDNPESIYYWAYKNNIPVYCPALTDGSLGDMIYFHSYKNPGLIIDIAADIRAVNNEAVFAKKTGVIILGGGVIKHHICNANLMRNGADYAVYINTGQEFDGSDAGARPDEAVSWGKIRMTAQPVKVYADASIVFPLLVAETFAKTRQTDKRG
ncbi:deoxyhypusine synthase [Spizellomyces punctatus DAOM BR117]|uniref:deoxyhypusine synthase n=1 Tax=Spizellomyces punctatus (strain DAOM BR117) TaxID=645134 RepID=A0A0L0HUT7_SPIPD|nr:deoxyhypusine synthase [Spizellomyces punctatus DAOM BR117]KND05101.1 deoxyhypusine synthase [Spizellomyces punctatus DAOM BR117]|eukprot:XP_016613140.1 deoxyhypusine synthase [Spizellomyces punctatus DAOM BR117]